MGHAVAVDLETSLGYLLKQTAAELRLAMEGALRPLGLTVTQYSCLELLRQRPGLSNSELARGAFVTRQSMNVVLQGLERDGLVTRPPESPAGRALPAALTDAGRGRLERASAVVRRVEQAMQAPLGDAELAGLMRMLRDCGDALRRRTR